MKILLRILNALFSLWLLAGGALVAVKAMRDKKDLAELGDMTSMLGDTFATPGELSTMTAMGAIVALLGLALLILGFTKNGKNIMYASIAVLVVGVVAYILCPDKTTGTTGTYRSAAQVMVLIPAILAGGVAFFLSRKVNQA